MEITRSAFGYYEHAIENISDQYRKIVDLYKLYTPEKRSEFKKKTSFPVAFSEPEIEKQYAFFLQCTLFAIGLADRSIDRDEAEFIYSFADDYDVLEALWHEGRYCIHWDEFNSYGSYGANLMSYLKRIWDESTNTIATFSAMSGKFLGENSLWLLNDTIGTASWFAENNVERDKGNLLIRQYTDLIRSKELWLAWHSID